MGLNINKKIFEYNIMAFFFYVQIIVAFFEGINIKYAVPIKMVLYLIPNLFMIYDIFVHKRINRILLLLIIYLVSFYLSYRINPDIILLGYNDQLTIFSRCFCAFYFGSICIDNKSFIITFRKGYILLSFLILIFVSGVVSLSDTAGYMQLSIIAFVPVLVMFFDGVLNHVRFYRLMAIICVFVIVINGARGGSIALLGAILFFLIGNSCIEKKWTKTIISMCMMLIIAIIIIMMPVKKILLQLIEKFSIDSRVVSLILQGDLFDSSGRDTFYYSLFNEIKENPVLIRGIFSDRLKMSNIFYHGESYNNGAYAHNFFLEIYYQWGTLLGTLIVFFFLYILIRKGLDIWRNKDRVQLAMYSIIIGNFLWLQVSNSYLINALFWFSVGFCIKRKKNAKRIVLNKDVRHVGKAQETFLSAQRFRNTHRQRL